MECTKLNLLKKRYWRACLSICTLFTGLSSQQAYAYVSNTLGFDGSGQGFPTEIEPGELTDAANSKSVILAASTDETDLAECYGDELEVSLRSVINADGMVLEHTVFAFPNPSGWLVTVLGTGGQLLNFLPCQVEPINATGLWGGFIDPRLGHGKFSVPGMEGVRVRSVRFSSPGTKAAEDSETHQELRITEGGVLTEDGFVHRIGKNTIPIAGSWLFPMSYKSPIGTSVQMFCASKTCNFEYRIDQNLKFSYEIWIEENTKPADWIAIDQYVRSVILGWIREI